MMQQMKQSHDTYGSSQDVAPDAQLMPWSYRLPIWGRFLVDLVSGIIVGVVGTMAHRMGASMNIPYGLAIAYLMVIISTWSARSRDGVSGLALHLIGSSLVVWTVMSGYGPGGDAMIPVGFGGDDPMPVVSEQAGYLWLYGVVLIPVVMLVLPKRWFVTPPRKETRDGAFAADTQTNEGKTSDNAQPVE